MQKFILPIGITTALVVTFVVLGVMAFIQSQSYINMQLTKAKYDAVDNCFASASVNTKRIEDAEKRELNIHEPVREIYTYCLQDKGIQVVSKK